MRNRPTQSKLQRQRAQAEKRRDKVAKREAAKARKATVAPRAADGEDPDIAGIVPGPQPNPIDDFDLNDDAND